MIAVKNFQTKSGCKITIKVCPENSNLDPVENFKSGFDCFFNQGLPEKRLINSRCRVGQHRMKMMRY
ncbi:MAG: hypothetical protein Q7J03_05390 [Methanoregula sp.]|nr:hypothetical protein [Methanoregula sp.]